MEITRKIVKQPFAPDTTDVLWLDSSGDSDVLKSFCNGQWKETSTPQQDYLIIKPNENRVFTQDAAALHALLRAIEKDVVFDCLCGYLTEAATEGPEGYQNYSRALSLYYIPTSPRNTFVYFHDPNNNEILEVQLPYTVTQYQGLAAVQKAIDEQYTVMTSFPHLAVSDDEDFIQEDTEGVFICVDNKYILASYDTDGIMTSMGLAETGPEEGFVNITWEDAQKLIGYKIG